MNERFSSITVSAAYCYRLVTGSVLFCYVDYDNKGGIKSLFLKIMVKKEHF